MSILAVLAVVLFGVSGALHAFNKNIPPALTNFGLAILAWMLLL